MARAEQPRGDNPSNQAAVAGEGASPANSVSGRPGLGSRRASLGSQRASQVSEADVNAPPRDAEGESESASEPQGAAGADDPDVDVERADADEVVDQDKPNSVADSQATEPPELHESTELPESVEPREMSTQVPQSNAATAELDTRETPAEPASSEAPGDLTTLRVEPGDLVRPLPDETWLQAQPVEFRAPLEALLAGDDAVQVRRTLRQFAQRPPRVEREGYWAILAHYVMGDDKFSRIEGLKAMDAVAPKQALPYLIYLLDDSAFEVRWQVYECLAEIKDDRVIKPLVDHYLTNERNQIEKLLLPYGAKCEELMFRFLRHPDVEVRLDVVKFLGQVGTQTSIDALRKLGQDSSVTVRLQARTSIRKIQKRIGNSGQ